MALDSAMGALRAADCCWRWRPSRTEAGSAPLELAAHSRAAEMQLIIEVYREELLG